MYQGVAVFDFDKTLIRQGSLKLLLQALTKRRHLATALACAAAKVALLPAGQRLETFRAEILRRILANCPVAEIRQAAEAIYPQLIWKPDILRAHAWHRAAGHRILIATGGLACYMRDLLIWKGLAFDDLMASEMIVCDGILTGEMAGHSCTWDEKARRVGIWLAAHPGESWGYGNLPNDGAMLALVQHPIAVPT